MAKKKSKQSEILDDEEEEDPEEEYEDDEEDQEDFVEVEENPPQKKKPVKAEWTKEELQQRINMLSSELERMENKDRQEEFMKDFPNRWNQMLEAVKANQDYLKQHHHEIKKLREDFDLLKNKK